MSDIKTKKDFLNALELLAGTPYLNKWTKKGVRYYFNANYHVTAYKYSLESILNERKGIGFTSIYFDVTSLSALCDEAEVNPADYLWIQGLYSWTYGREYTLKERATAKIEADEVVLKVFYKLVEMATLKKN